MTTKDWTFKSSVALRSKSDYENKLWLSHEFAGCQFKDEGHGKRLGKAAGTALT